MNQQVTLSEKLNADFTIKPLKGDASERSYFRLDCSGGFPKSIVVMKTSSSFENDELDFLKLRKFLAKCNVPTPKIYFTNPAKGLIYLEDCGDTLLADRASGMNEKELTDIYKKVLDTLVIMQLEGTRRMDDKNPAHGRKFDTAKFMEELNHTGKYFIKYFLGKSLTAGDEKRLKTFFTELVAPIEKEPLVFTHRDYHARNIMLKGGRTLILDFQDARMGSLHYDAASVLFDSYVKLPDNVRDELLNYYLERLNLTASRKLDKERFLRMFRRVSLQRNFKALGTFGFQAVEKNSDFYLQFVPNTVGYIRANIKKIEESKKNAEWILSLLER